MVAFFTDECFSGRIIDALRQAGFDVVRTTDVCPSAVDTVVLAVAHAQGRILPTEDYDFGELCVRLGLPTHGVVIVAVKKLSAAAQRARVVQCPSALGERVRGAFVTVEPGRVRLRPLA